MKPNSPHHPPSKASHLPLAVAVLQDLLETYEPSETDGLHNDIRNTGHLLQAVTALTAALQAKVAALPGIVGGLRSQPDVALLREPEELRDLVAGRLQEIVLSLTSATRYLRTAENEVAALFLDH